jgi:hypothetical protein
MKPDSEAKRALRMRLSELPLLLAHSVDDLAQAGAHLPRGQLDLWLEGLAPEDVRAALEGGLEHAREVIGGGGGINPWTSPPERAVARGATYRSPNFESRLAFIGKFRDLGAYCWGQAAVDPLSILRNYQTRLPGSNQRLVDRTQALTRLSTDAEHRRLVRDVFEISLEDPLTQERFSLAAQRLCAPASVTVRRMGCQLVIEQRVEGDFHSAVLIGPLDETAQGLQPLGVGGGAIEDACELLELNILITEGKPKGIGRGTRQTASNQCQEINAAQLFFGISMYCAVHNHDTFVSSTAAYLKAASLYARALHKLFAAGPSA